MASSPELPQITHTLPKAFPRLTVLSFLLAPDTTFVPHAGAEGLQGPCSVTYCPKELRDYDLKSTAPCSQPPAAVHKEDGREGR